MMRRDQNRLLASAELWQAALRLRYCDRWIRSFCHFLRTLRFDRDSANILEEAKLQRTSESDAETPRTPKALREIRRLRQE